MGPEHVNGDPGLGRGIGGWGLLFHLKIFWAKESSYEFSPLLSHFRLLPSVATLSSSTPALGGCCCCSAPVFAFGVSSCDPCRVRDAVILCLFQLPS